MAVDRHSEPQLELAEIQGDILIGMQKDAELFIGFVIADVDRFKVFLHGLRITTCVDVKHAEARIKALQNSGGGERLDIRGLNIGFTIDGLRKLDAPKLDRIVDKAFTAGLASRSAELLNDPPQGAGSPARWLVGNGTGPLDGIMLLTGKDRPTVDAMFRELIDRAGDEVWVPFYTEVGLTRPHHHRGHEHFGYLDGVSQPATRGRIDASVPGETWLDPRRGADDNQGLPGADLHWPGAFVFGYDSPDHADVEKKGAIADGGAEWMKNGSYMVFRRLEQLVPEFDGAMTEKADENGDDPAEFGARAVGRFKSGWPVALGGGDNAGQGADELKNNAFEFEGEDDLCPFAAHIRKAYPRDDDTPDGGEPDTQTHRIRRAGIPFGPELSPEETVSGKTSQSRGLMFVCYQTSIVDQFEFIMTHWVNEPTFAKPGTGFDPVLGQAPGAARARSVAGLSKSDPAARTVFAHDFIQPTGGGYFFMPSVSAIRTVLSV